MGTYVDEGVSRDAYENGTKIGETSPSPETKGAWWEVFAHNGAIIACVMHGDGLAGCGNRISPEELNLYVDDPVEARIKLQGATGTK